MTHQRVLAHLLELTKFTLPSPSTYTAILRLNVAAFYQKKPLFEQAEKEEAVTALRKSFPLFEPACRILNGGMEVERRQEAQVYRSGLQNIADEVQDVPDLHEKFQELLASYQIKGIEKYIENATGIVPEYSIDEPIDLANIPQSHYWWYYIDEDDDVSEK